MNTGGPAFPHGPLGDSIQHEDGRISHQWQGSTGMDLLDWMAGQALVGLIANSDPMPWDKVHPVAYDHAEAMLAEKARREADHSGGANKMVPDHSPDAEKMAEINRELVEALEAIESCLLPGMNAVPLMASALLKARAALAKAKGVA